MTFTHKKKLSIFCTPEKDFWCSYGAGFEYAPNFFISGGKAFTGNVWLQKTYYLGLGLTVSHWTSTSGVTILSDRNILPSETITNGKL